MGKKREGNLMKVPYLDLKSQYLSIKEEINKEVLDTLKSSSYSLGPKVEAFDACGCGDTFLAALVYYYLQTNHTPESIRFAMKAAAVTVKHLGVYAPTLEEIQNDSN